MEKIKKKVTHLIASSDGGDWPPANAALFLKWLSDRLSDIPDEYRDSARIEIDTFICGDDEPTGSAAEIILSYLRDESDDEIGRRKSVERMVEERDRYSAEHLECVERQVLAELKKKYER
jgi:hypothetical protein